MQKPQTRIDNETLKVSKTFRVSLAERVGFEPTVAQRTTTVFETVPFNRSGTSPVFVSGVPVPNEP